MIGVVDAGVALELTAHYAGRHRHAARLHHHGALWLQHKGEPDRAIAERVDLHWLPAHRHEARRVRVAVAAIVAIIVAIFAPLVVIVLVKSSVT